MRSAAGRALAGKRAACDGFTTHEREAAENQIELAFTYDGKGEALKSTEGTEALVAKGATENPTGSERLMEAVCETENLKRALRQVKANKGSPGGDGMRVDQLPRYLIRHWKEIREELLNATYKAQPVRRVEIDKPDGGKRELGIPTAIDRFVQQAVLQVLQKQWDPTFSIHSHGFRPGHSQRGAIAEAQQYQAEGYGWVVDLDLEKFFDRVNHDRLMSRLSERISDKRMLKLIGGFLRAGVLEGGVTSPSEEGTPQGGPLSPLLSNIVLDELDKELERRGHRFVRYARAEILRRPPASPPSATRLRQPQDDNPHPLFAKPTGLPPPSRATGSVRR